MSKEDSSYTILIVDDSEPYAKTLGWMLEMSGYTVVLAHEATSAMQQAKASRPHIILLDIGLPNTNGYELCRMLRDDPETRDAFIVAQTGWGQDEHRKSSQEAGFDHHLVKPIEMSVLEELFKSLGKR